MRTKIMLEEQKIGIPSLPVGFTMRAIALSDAPAIVAMLNRDAQALVGEPLFSVAEYRKDLQSPLLDMQQHTRIILDPAGGVAAIAEFHQRHPFVRSFIWVRTALEQRGRGFASNLLASGIEVARAEVHKAPPGARVTLSANAIAGNDKAGALLEAHGFAHVRNFLQMRIDMAEAPKTPQWPSGISVRPYRPHYDDVALFLAKEEAFADHWGHVQRPFATDFPIWQQQMRDDPLFDPSLYFLAMDGDEIAGFCLCMPPVPGELGAAWIDLLGVRRPWRRRGIGEALLQHSFGEFYRRSVSTVGLGVDEQSLTGATRLYQRAGMTVQHVTAVFEMELRAGINFAA